MPCEYRISQKFYNFRSYRTGKLFYSPFKTAGGKDKIMNLEKIMNVLATRGIKSTPMRVVKNNTEFHGLRLCLPDNPTISPVVYYTAEDTTEIFLKKIDSVLNLGSVQINSSNLTNLDYVKDHIFLGIQRNSDDLYYLKKKWLNFELYLQIPLTVKGLDGIGTCKVTAKLLQALGTSEKDLWNFAFINSQSQYTIHSFGDGFFYFVDSSLKTAATALCCPEFFQNFCRTIYEPGCYILPSSTEDLIILPLSYLPYTAENMHRLADMVHTVNQEAVVSEIQLDPVVYYYNYYNNTIEIAATYEKEI